MKTKNFLNFSNLGLCCAVSLVLFASPSSLSAATPTGKKTEKEDKKDATITVKVPDGGASVTYFSGGKQFTVKAGESVVLPKGVTKLALPKGTVVSSSNGSGTTANFVVKTDVTLPKVTKASVGGIKASLTVTTLQTVDANGTTTLVDFANNTVTTTPKGGQSTTVTNSISKPTSAVTALTAATAAQQSAAAQQALVTSVSGTDGNTQVD